MVMSMTACSTMNSPPPSSFDDRSMVDSDFKDISENCTIHVDVNTSDDSDVCTPPRREFATFYDETNNWSVMCCEYIEDLCEYDYDENRSKLCEDLNEGKYNGYMYNDDGFWMARCCRINGSSCYVDLSINASDDSTACDEKYHKSSYSVNHNGTVWNAMCCVGGLEE